MAPYGWRRCSCLKPDTQAKRDMMRSINSIGATRSGSLIPNDEQRDRPGSVPEDGQRQGRLFD